MERINGSVTPILIFMVDSTDHVTGVVGASLTVTISKNGGSFASPAGSVAEIANGWYKLTPTAADTGTNGPLAVHAEASGADPFDTQLEIVSRKVDTISDANARVDVGSWAGSALAAPSVAGVPEVDLTHISGVAQSAIDLKDFADAGYDPVSHEVNLPAEAALEATSQNILSNTGTTIPGLISALNDLSSSDVQAAATAALQAIGLQYLLNDAHPDGKPTANTIFDLIMNKDGSQSFNRLLHSLQALQGQIPISSAEVIVMPLTGSTVRSVLNSGEVVPIIRGDVGQVIWYQLNLGPGGTISGFTFKFGVVEKLGDTALVLGPIDITGDIVSVYTDDQNNIIVQGRISLPDTSNLTNRRYVGEINMVNSTSGQELTPKQFYLDVGEDVIK